MNDSDLIFGLMASMDKPEYSIADFTWLLKPFGTTETNLRTVLSRMQRKGILSSRHEGKTVFYRFSTKGSEIRQNVALGFQLSDWSDWQNEWWGVLFSVPMVKHKERYNIRKKLMLYRFAPLYAGFWIRPLNPREQIPRKLARLCEHNMCRLIRFKSVAEISQSEVMRLWKLKQINRQFKRGLQQITESLLKINRLKPDQALVEQMILGDILVKLLFLDPLLPPVYLPDDWISNTLKDEFAIWLQRIRACSEPYWSKIFA